jgi:DNA polymerase I-like protein with 3'-5' exonuclease and polymerase domains
MVSFCAIDCETTYIKELTKDVDKIWLIGYYYLSKQTGKLTYDYISFPEGITHEELANHVNNASTLAMLGNKAELYYDKLRFLRDVLSGDGLYKPVFHGASFDVFKVLEPAGFECKDYDDTMLASFVLLPPTTLGSTGDEDSMRFYSLKNLGSIGLCSAKLEAPDFETYCEEMVGYNRGDCMSTYQLANAVIPAIESNANLRRAYRLDLKTQEVATLMEINGTPVDLDAIQSFANVVTEHCDNCLSYLRKEVPGIVSRWKKPTKHRAKKAMVHCVSPASGGVYPASAIGKHVYCGDDDGDFLYKKVEEFSPTKAQHRAIALTAKCGWVPSKFTKTGVPTCDKGILADLAEQYELARYMQEYQQYSKLGTTYIPAFAKTDVAGRIHPSFPLTATRTGRFSSRGPNFQNLPRDDRVRSLVRAHKGNVIINVDLSQIELRVLAWYCANVINNFYLWGLYQQGADVHEANRQLLECERATAKKAIFTKVYGGGATKIASGCGISLSEAKRTVDFMNNRMPFISELNKVLVNTALTNGCKLSTMYGHSLAYPDLKSYDNSKRARAERQIFNGAIQGTSADIIKLLMCILHYEHRLAERFKCLLLFTIHDELSFEVPEGNAPICMEIIDKVFCNKQLLPGLPIEGISGQGETWLEAKKDSDRRYEEWHKETYGE